MVEWKTGGFVRGVAALAYVLAINAVAIPEPNRFYSFDAAEDYTNLGQDADGDLMYDGSAPFITHKTVECLAGHGGCVQVDTKPLTSSDDPLVEALSSPINITSYSALSVCYWIKHVGFLSDWSVSLAIQPAGPPPDWYSPGVWSLHDHPDRQETNHHYFNAFMSTSDHDSVNSWLHTCVVVGSGSYIVYHNGQLSGSAAGAGFVDPAGMGSSMLYLGSSLHSTHLRGSALLDDLSIYDRALTAGEVDAIMQTTDASRNETVGDPQVCTAAQLSSCAADARCDREGDGFTCTCVAGFEDASEEGDGSSCSDVNECAMESSCDALAYCNNLQGGYRCTCPEGFLGDGEECTSNSWTLRAVCTFPDAAAVDVDRLRLQFVQAVSGGFFEATPTTAYPVVSASGVRVDETGNQITLQALFDSEAAAAASLALVNPSLNWSTALQGCALADGPDIYTFTARSTSDPIPISPSGMDLNNIVFDPSCLESGCWVVDVTYTTGTGDFNAFYLPKAVGSDQLSYDFDYSTPDSTWTTQSPADTFFPLTHPCTGADYDAGDGLLAQVSSCCLDQFLAMYRPIATFVSAVNGSTGPNCGVGARDRPLAPADVHTFTAGELPGDATAPPGVYVDAQFHGMISYGKTMGVVDPYIGIYKARFFLDEVELRTQAGQLRGTVGVEHTVDTFLGLINLSPTGMYVLDTAVSQVALHLEKTSFFSISTHGTNDYTFLEYVNMRLVAIYFEDDDFSGTAESESRTVRTDGNQAANYIQVTFTLGSQYEVNPNTGLVPLDSVRAGSGTFFDTATLDHKCLEWTGATGYSFAGQPTFNASLIQTCAPAASMCSTPAAIPDSFVSFNIPLGIDVFGDPSSALSNSMFVDMVISAVDTVAKGDETEPNEGEAPQQMKTTLTGSIAVVEGGVNIFCDGFTAKTDLKDVANADIVVGSASSAAELSRLRIKKDVSSTQLDAEAITQIDSASIESGLMTLVVKGNESYFQDNGGRQQVSLELEDVISIHIMETGGSGADAEVSGSVNSLITSSPDDNSNGDGLDVDGYALNGAFYFTIDRDAQRAHLEPSDELLAICPFNPPRPAAGNVPLETCVTRRDVRYREFPWRAGAVSTAMEVCAGGVCPVDASSTESAFFVSMLGDSDYAKQLAVDYANVISAEYELNGRYRRAFWINPGYEWTPTQTGGVAPFSVSQKLFLFALITLDEGISSEPGSSLASGPGPSLRRRALLQSSTADALKDGQSSLGADAFEFQTTSSQLMAKAFDVPEDRVATFKVSLQLTSAEACMTPAEVQASVRATLDDYLTRTASSLHTVQVTTMTIDNRDDVSCGRRALRGLLAAFSEATVEVTMLLVFKAGGTSAISLAKFQNMPGVHSVEPLAVSPKVNTAPDDAWVPPPDVTVEDENSSSMLVVAAAAGGGVVVLVLAVGAFVFMRRRGVEHEEVVHTVNVEDLKVQLANDV